ncbi:hypothetical protein GV64_19660 [Endozoicomonas elysicola]|uniref:Uncharacterized protein n=1 Tax=Endozoicomonas elysicola TaxID=305900 RepID=A0A081KES7_9GAMM|nr:hypothetical protein GV64_19660 [Endozoicomonas elysicola]
MNDRAVMDDSVIFQVTDKKELSTGLGILCMFTAGIVPCPKSSIFRYPCFKAYGNYQPWHIKTKN